MALNLGVAVPGLSETHLDLAIGERPVNSPWLRVTNDGSVVVRTAQTRMLLRTVVAGGVAPLARINLPIFAELAAAEARMSALTCRRGESGSEVQLAVTPSVGRVAVGEADVAGFGNFGQAMALRPATLLSLPLVSVSGFADVQLGGATAQSVNFSSSDVAEGVVKTVRTGDIAMASIGSLLGNTQITVNPFSLTVGGGSVGAALQGAVPAVDGVLNSVLDTLGVGLGEADVGVVKIRCGVPMLVG